MSCYNGLPKILVKKNTGIIDIIVFVIKYLLFLDTSSLFVNEKMQLNKEIKRKVARGGERKGFDLIEFFSTDTSSNGMIGGADVQLQVDLTGSDKLSIENEKASRELSDAREAEKRFQIKDKKKEEIRKEVDSDVRSKLDEGISLDTGLKGDGDIKSDFVSLIKDSITEGTTIISNKIKGILILLVYGSVYPAVPFFAVMALMFGSLKYLFYKIRIF